MAFEGVKSNFPNLWPDERCDFFDVLIFSLFPIISPVHDTMLQWLSLEISVVKAQLRIANASPESRA